MTFADRISDSRPITESPQVDWWTARVAEAVPNCEQQVAAACDRWNLKARAMLRQETGLRMTYDHARESVPVRIVDGLPVGLLRDLEKLDPDLLWLVLNRSRVRQAAESLQFIQDCGGTIVRVAPDHLTPLPSNALGTSRNWSRLLAKWLESIRLPGRDRLVNPDVLGAYWWRESVITIHWLAIGVACITTGLEVAGVTAIVLFHELAHAYHHRGFDIDGRQWHDESFGYSDLNVVEGVAQFYAWLLASLFAGPGSDLKTAWDGLESRQAGPYLAHREWTGIHRHREAIRAAMLATRMQNPELITEARFEAAIRHAEAVIRSTETT